jgi:hypothetical protein
MDLKAARCPSCGGDLDIPQEVDYIECPYCGIDVKVRDIVTHGLDTKSLIELANHALKSENHKSALEYYSFILDKEPGNLNAVLGFVKSTILYKWNVSKQADGVKELVKENLSKVSDDKSEKYKRNISDFICDLYSDEIKKYKNDADISLNPNKFLDKLFLLLEFSLELNPGHRRTLITLLDYCMLIRRANAANVIKVMKEDRLDDLFKKYSEELSDSDLVKAAEYSKKWDTQTINIETKKYNMRLGCIMFLITAAVITFVLWFIIKAF